MAKYVWILSGLMWAFFIGTVIRGYFRTQADKREVFRRDLERLNRR